MTPIVLVEIDKDSRLRILQDAGVRVAFVDRRVDPHLVLLPDRQQAIEIDETVRDLTILSVVNDDPARTAAETLRRLATGEVVVATAVITKEKAHA